MEDMLSYPEAAMEQATKVEEVILRAIAWKITWWQVAPAQQGNAFVACRRKDLDLVFALQFERTVNRDNTVSFQNLGLQIDRVR